LELQKKEKMLILEPKNDEINKEWQILKYQYEL